MSELVNPPGPPPPPPTAGSTRTPRRPKAQATRRRILDAARGLFVERGYVATTIEAIAAEAGVAVPTPRASCAAGSVRVATSPLAWQPCGRSPATPPPPTPTSPPRCTATRP